MSGLFRLEIDGEAWACVSLQGREAIGRSPSFEVVARPYDGAPTEVPVGAEAELAWAVDEGGERVFSAIVDAAEVAHGGLRLRLVLPVATLADTADHEVFLDADAITIAKEVLGDHGLTLDPRARRTPARRAQCVQAFESDLGFVTRILAEEGFAWFPHPDEPDTIIATDDASGYEPMPGGALEVAPPGGLRTERSIWDVRVEHRVVSDKVTLRDHDFENPKRDLTVDASAATGQGRLERYEYRGGYVDPSVGKDLARSRLDEHRRDRKILRARTASRALAAGRAVDIQGGAVDGIDGTWLVTEVTHEGVDEGATRAERPYEARFTAVPSDPGYRPARPPRPGFGGLQTQTVTGSSGAEIHTEPAARVKARFRWERERKEDDTASAWLRVTQPPTSGGFFLPRVGWEVLTTFFQGTPDEPLELGRLYDGVDPPPSALPGKKVVSAFGTRTTPGGGGENNVTFDDTAGNEGMTFAASRDFNERTTNDKTTSVTADESWTVGAKRATIIGQVWEHEVKSSHTYTVSGSRTVNVDANKTFSTGAETISIGAARIFDVGGDNRTQAASLSRLVGAAKMVAAIEHESRVVTGASNLLVGGSWTQLAGLSAGVTVGGASAESVGGVKMVKALSYELSVRGALSETVASRTVEAGTDAMDTASSKSSFKVGAAMKVKGADVIFVGDTRIKIQAGGATVTITPSSVTISGKFDSSQGAVDGSDEDYD